MATLKKSIKTTYTYESNTRFGNAVDGTLEHEGAYRPAWEAIRAGDSGGETYRGIARNSSPGNEWPGWKDVDEYKERLAKEYLYDNYGNDPGKWPTTPQKLFDNSYDITDTVRAAFIKQVNHPKGHLSPNTHINAGEYPDMERQVKQLYYEHYWQKPGLDRVDVGNNADTQRAASVLFDINVNHKPPRTSEFINNALRQIDGVDQSKLPKNGINQYQIDQLNKHPEAINTIAENRFRWASEERGITPDSHGLVNRYAKYLDPQKDWKTDLIAAHKKIDDRALENIKEMQANKHINDLKDKKKLTDDEKKEIKEYNAKWDKNLRAISEDAKIKAAKDLMLKSNLTPEEQKRLDLMKNNIKSTNGKKEIKDWQKTIDKTKDSLHQSQPMPLGHNHDMHVCTGADCTNILHNIQTGVQKLLANLS